MANFSIQSGSDEETLALGRRLGSLLREGDVVALSGELGSGKTWFTKGIAQGLGIPPEVIVTSPSFSLVNEYEAGVTLYHMDIYRLEREEEFFSAGLQDYICDNAVTVVEWADRWPAILPEHGIRVEFVILDDHRRDIMLSGGHRRAEEIIERFMKGVQEG